MSPPLLARFVPRRDDYVAALRLYYARQRRTWALFALFGIMALGGLLTMFTFGLGYVVFAVAMAMPLAVSALYFALVAPMSIDRAMKRRPHLRAAVTWRLSDHEVHISTQFGESRLRWDDFGRALESPQIFVLTYAQRPQTYQIVPKRAFATADHLERFRAIVATRLPGLEPTTTR